MISQQHIVDKINQLNSKRTIQEPKLPNEEKFIQTNSTIFPMCENGSILNCQENKSKEDSLVESCKGILMFNNETSSCFCPGSNNLKRKSGIIRQGWSKYSRFVHLILTKF